MQPIIIVVPAFNPLPTLVAFIEQLLSLSSKIVIVDDGSDTKYKTIFEKMNAFERCIVLEHKQNKGKGAAVKTGFSYILNNEKKAKAVVTVGAHGQHKIEEVKHLIEMYKVFSDGIILGTRQFHSKEMPIFSFLGNRAASMLFKLLFHKRLADIQSGLRLMPKKELHWLLKVPGEKFNYDINMLVEAIRRDIPIYEIPIGHARFRKNSLIYYDEIININETLRQIWLSFIHHKK